MQLTQEWDKYFDYYRTPRGFHKRSLNSNDAWNRTMLMSFKNMPLMSIIKEVLPRLILLIAGENAHSRYFSEAASEPKQLMIIKGVDHAALCDRTDKIPFEAIADFFGKNLK